jgi:hypothetical protein
MAHQPNVDVRSPRFGRSLEVRAVLVQRECWRRWDEPLRKLGTGIGTGLNASHRT